MRQSLLFTILASTIEILLPGMLAQRLPLALIFTFFACMLFIYIRVLSREGLAYPSFSLPVILYIILFVFIFLVGLFMTRAFGIWGALAQIILLLFTLWYWLRSAR